jgi:hypothetical protein
MSAREDIYNYLKKHGLREYTLEELRRVGKISDWARTIRQLSQDGIITYDYSKKNDTYNISHVGKLVRSTKRMGLSTKDKYRIRNRDGHRCQSCGKSVKDNVKLHVDHKIPIELGGSNNDSNLWTLCDECNLAKRAFFRDNLDSTVMIKVFREESGYQRLRVLFEESPNIEFSPSILQGISGIRDWTRTIRNIREKYKMNINFNRPTKDFPDGSYSNIV